MGRACHNDARNDLPAFLALDSVFPQALLADARFRADLAEAYGALASSPDDAYALLARHAG